MASSEGSLRDALSNLFAGVDVGGTNIKVGLVDDFGRTIASSSFPTLSVSGPQAAVEKSWHTITRLVEETTGSSRQIRAIGLGTPGPADIPAGVILDPANLPEWRHFKIRDALSEVSGKPVTFSNDAGAAAFGEYWSGSGRGSKSLVLLTLGTGVGGGIIVDGRPIQGAHSHGAEVGHVTVDSSAEARVCSCGKRGHLEAYVSATGLVSRTLEAMERCPKTALDRDGSAAPLTAKMIADAAATGDELAFQMVRETAAYLARGIAILANVIDPEIFILGGAVNFGTAQTQLGRSFIDMVATEVRARAFPVVAQNLNIVYAQLGSDAGFVGAAGLARNGLLGRDNIDY